ncbi:MAG: general secretion pathway protein E [Parcubacteria group bacterium Gr01-1014_66]|nr:MAG: general secretion pathway protein E [Parcubacteria group bacterium Gr01-1014_66]
MLCAQCKIPVKERPALDFLAHELRTLPSSIPVPKMKDWTVFRARTDGCAACYQMGYKGRIGIFEIILVDDAIEALILRRPSELAVKKAAREQEQITMHEDGLLKIIAGTTDREELERVVGTFKK